MTSLVVRGSETAVSERPVLLVEYDAAALSAGVDPQIAAKWAYDLPGTGVGVGVRGVEEGVRLLASQGEIIRVDECLLTYSDDREAHFLATASRYVIGPEGQEIKLDSVRRGKRVLKFDKRADGRGEYEVKAWYELGIVKASRNAALALMPSNVKSALLKAGLDAAAELKRGSPARPVQRPQAPRPAAQPPTETAPEVVVAPPDVAAVWQDLTSSLDSETGQRLAIALFRKWPEARSPENAVNLAAIKEQVILRAWLEQAQRMNGVPAEAGS